MARPDQSAEFIYVKLGGSLITDKRMPGTPRLDVIERVVGEIVEARRAVPGLSLILGHGSGSFGHVIGRRYGTRDGVATAEQWYGFAATADAAARLNRIVIKALLDAGVPAWGIQPSVALRCVDGRVIDGPLTAVRGALERGLLPVVFGDVALDDARGGTIASTEEIFDCLAQALAPQRYILAGEVDGVYTSDPLLDPQAQPLATITPSTYAEIRQGLGGSHGVDVTGGMAAKVRHALEVVKRHPRADVIVCSGLIAGNLTAVLTSLAAVRGTRVHI
jgi:isopentenyl phosphate kinase